MPRVPTYGGQQVAPESLPGDSTLRSNLGAADIQARQAGALNDASQRLDQTVSDGMVTLQKQQNADQVFQAETSLKNNYLSFQQDVESRKGQNAWGATQDAAKWWSENTQKGADALQNPVARNIFTQRAAELRTQSMGTIASYEAQQRQQSLHDSATASIESSTSMAAANAGNPAVVNQTKGDVLAHIDVLAKLQGWTPEIRQTEEAKYLTNFHEQVIQTLADQNPDAAKAYYDANKNEIAGDQQDTISKTVEQAGLAQTAQTAADDVMGRGLDEASALADIRQKYTGDEQKAAVQEVRSRFAEQQQERTQGETQAADHAYQVYAQTGKLSAVPPSVLAGMNGKTRLALQKQAEQDASGESVKTDPNRYYDLAQQAANDPQNFAKVDLRQDFPYLSPTDRKHFIDLQGKAAKGGGLPDVATFQQQLGAMHKALGWGSGDKQQMGQFDMDAQQQIRAAEQDKGKSLTQEERQHVLDRMVVQGHVKGTGYFGSDVGDTSGYFYQFQGTNAADNFVPNIPDTERTKITDALARHNMPVTDAAVAQLYKQQHGLP